MKQLQWNDLKHSPQSFLSLLVCICFAVLFQSCRTESNSAGTQATQLPETLSTNWLVAAKATLPARYQAKDLSYGQITNLLSVECQRGNGAAQGLWGFALVWQSQSPEEAAPGIELLRKSAGSGFVPAMLNLGHVYQDGKYSKTNYDEAFRWFSLAAEKGNADAQATVGGYYHLGRGRSQDYSIAAKWYRLAADQNNYEAMKSLGFLLLNGLGVDKNLERAKYWTLRAATEGHHRRAMMNMGAICIMESTNSASMTEAFKWYKQSADLGDPLACFQVANFYYNGWGAVTTNLDSYYDWLTKAANLGCTEAQYFMGQYCRTGIGMPKDAEKSLEWYRKAAAKNEPHALFDLAIHYLGEQTNHASLELANDYMLRAAQMGHREAQYLYAAGSFRGEIGSQDCDRGKEWLAKSADGGWAKAEFLLFSLYYNGRSPVAGCAPYPKDTVEGVKWLRRAAEHESLQAQSVLAVMLIQGNGVGQDKVEAEKLLRYAATHGFAQAQNDLGFSILTGAAAKKNWVEAAMWCKLAQTKGSDTNTVTRAKVNFANASSQLSLEELREVDRRVTDFQPVPLAVVDPLPKDWQTKSEFQPEDNHFSH
jgi:hypothetical protein